MKSTGLCSCFDRMLARLGNLGRGRFDLVGESVGWSVGKLFVCEDIDICGFAVGVMLTRWVTCWAKFCQRGSRRANTDVDLLLAKFCLVGVLGCCMCRVVLAATAWASNGMPGKMLGKGPVELDLVGTSFSGLASAELVVVNSTGLKAYKSSLNGPDAVPQHSIILSSSPNSSGCCAEEPRRDANSGVHSGLWRMNSKSPELSSCTVSTTRSPRLLVAKAGGSCAGKLNRALLPSGLGGEVPSADAAAQSSFDTHARLALHVPTS